MNASVIRAAVLGVLLLGPVPSGWAVFGSVMDQAERSIERRAERAMSDSVERALDEAENAVVCAIDDRRCIQRAERAGRPVVVKDDDGELVEVRDEDGATEEGPAAPGEGVWANYDFVPGDRILFVEDFSDTRPGRFPSSLEFLGGMMEVVEWEGQQLLRSTDSGSYFLIPLGEELPERFTIEFKAYVAGGTSRARIAVLTSQHDNPTRLGRHEDSHFYFGRRSSGVRGPIESTRGRNDYRSELTPIRIAVDGNYGTVYVNEERVANVPNMQLERNDYLQVVLGGRTDDGTYIGDIRVAAGGLELYDRLMADGRVATQGLYFATGSASLNPESTGTLTEIGRMLESNGDLSLRIEGHTDSVGDADANQRLSEARAESVMDYLLDRFDIASERLEAVGHGESEPVADNDTAAGRQQNRRVELVRID